MRRLVFRLEANLKIAEAAEWYEARGRGLDAEFLRVLDACIESVQRNPLLYPIVHGEGRRAMLRRLPYSLIYAVREEEIVVIACIHGRRDPKRWRLCTKITSDYKKRWFVHNLTTTSSVRPRIVVQSQRWQDRL